MIQIEIADRQRATTLDLERIRAAADEILRAEDRLAAEISIAIVANAEMQELNRRYLHHDWPTDVLSFRFDDPGEPLSGEVIVNAELAAEVAAQYDWAPADELLLYLVHGLLHLCGYDDGNPQSLRRMRRREATLLSTWGLHPVYDGRPRSGRAAQAATPSGED